MDTTAVGSDTTELRNNFTAVVSMMELAVMWLVGLLVLPQVSLVRYSMIFEWSIGSVFRFDDGVGCGYSGATRNNVV